MSITDKDAATRRQDERAEASASAVAPVRGPFRDVADWTLIAAILGTAVMLWLHAQDLWYRTDLLFFPVLPLISLGLIIRHGELSSNEPSAKETVGMGIALFASALTLTASLIFSTWLACVGLTFAVISWMLRRFANESWPHVVAWTLPVWVIVAFPNSDATNWTTSLERAVANSSSAVLDVIGVPQLASNNVLEFGRAKVSASRVSGGFGSPYLLLALVVLITMATRRSFSVGLISVLSIPLWSWIAGVIHMVVGVYLWENFDRNLFPSFRNALVQLLMLAVTLFSIWLFQNGLATLLSPFRTYSQNVGWVHKLFNTVALWPGKDPLRKKRTSSDDSESAKESTGLSPKMLLVGWSIALPVFIVAGGLSVQAFVNQSASDRLKPLAVRESTVEESIQVDALPAEFRGMRRLAFEVFHNRDAFFSGSASASWIYSANLRRIRLSVELPYRGFYPVEQNFRSPIRTFAGPRESSEAEIEGLGKVLLDEVVILDELYGRSYLCYATLTVNNTAPFRTALTENQMSLDAVANSLKLQPTVFTLQMFVESSGVLDDPQRENYRQTVLEACRLLKDSLLSSAGGQG